MIGCKGIPAATAFGGGVEIHVEEIATRLAVRGHDVSVYVRPQAYSERFFVWKNVHLIRVPTIRGKHVETIIHTLLATIHALFQPFDILHYHGVGPSTLAWIPRIFKPRTRVIVTFHSQDRFHEKWGSLARAYLKFGEWAAVIFPHVTIAVSRTIQNFCQHAFGVAVVYIPSGANIPQMHPGKAALAQFRLKPHQYFFTLSRLVPHKAIEDVIKAFAGVETNIKLLIIGSAAPSEKKYELFLKKIAASDPRVCFAGQQTGRALNQLIANGYAMVNASRSEGLSISILEALAHGTCVVVSDIPENLELVGDADISFPAGDVRALRQIMQQLLADPKRVARRGVKGREMVKRLYVWDMVVSQTEDVYAQALKGMYIKQAPQQNATGSWR